MASTSVTGKGKGPAFKKEKLSGLLGVLNADKSKSFFTSDEEGNIFAAEASGSSIKLFHAQDVKPDGNAGGAFVSGDWRTRDLNTEITNEISGASLGTNEFTLPSGTYFISIKPPVLRCSAHRARLYNITDSEVAMWGVSGFSDDFDSAHDISLIEGKLELTKETTFEVQCQCQTTRNFDGFGKHDGLSVGDEIYTDVKAWKLD